MILDSHLRVLPIKMNLSETSKQNALHVCGFFQIENKESQCSVPRYHFSKYKHLDNVSCLALNVSVLWCLGGKKGFAADPWHHSTPPPKHTAYIESAEPPVPHVVTDGLGGRHGTGELPGLDDGGTTQLHRLQETERRGRERKGQRGI